MAHVGQCEHRLASVGLATRHSGDGPGRRDRSLGSVPDAELLDALSDRIPVYRRPSPLLKTRERNQRLRSDPVQVFRIIDTPTNRWERAAGSRKIDAHTHSVISHVLHDLCGQLLGFHAAVAHAQQV